MPFVARHKQTGNRIDITTIEHPRQMFKLGECVCPLCGTDFLIKAGLITVPHFAHKIICQSDWQTHPESAEHRAGKLYLKNNLAVLVPEYKGADIRLEVPIPQVKRVADVLVKLPAGWGIVHEVQLAKITTEELDARTEDYNNAGLDVVWWFGKSAATLANQRWSENVFGFYLSLYFTS